MPFPSLAKRLKTCMSARNLSVLSSDVTSKPLQLPRLPVPYLRDTLDRYLVSIEPFLYEDEVRGGPSFSSAHARLVKLAKDFENGIGKACQERLIELDKSSPYNWLDDNFWLKKAYLEWRAPLPVNSNWWLAYKDDRSNAQKTTPAPEACRNWTGITFWQIRRASWLLSQTLDFKDRLENRELHPETTRTGLWMHSTVPRMFNVYRVPHPGCDALVNSGNSSKDQLTPSARKVVVMIHDWLYALEVYDENHHRFGPVALESGLCRIVEDAQERLSSGEVATPVGILSADDRDSWAKNYAKLLQSPLNESTLSVIRDCVMILSLDHEVHEASEAGASEMRSHLHNIRGGLCGRNRWFDKGISLILEPNGRAGMMGEHSPVDALVPSIVADYSLAQDVPSSADWSSQTDGSKLKNARSPTWEPLEWCIDAELEHEISRVARETQVLMADSDDDVFWFTDYGCDWIKDKALLPPDAYIQMAMQLAWYRTRGTFTATYETALTRLFTHGRTETIRTLTTESRQFVLAMCDPNTSTETSAALLRQAVKTHARLTKAAATGKGIDRHLLGLRLMLKKDESSPFFDDSVFARSQEWKLSTSGLSAGGYFRGTGFGAPYHDGYGINYLAAPDLIKFGIESKYSCLDTSTVLFSSEIAKALIDMKHLHKPLSPNLDYSSHVEAKL